MASLYYNPGVAGGIGSFYNGMNMYAPHMYKPDPGVAAHQAGAMLGGGQEMDLHNDCTGPHQFESKSAGGAYEPHRMNNTWGGGFISTITNGIGKALNFIRGAAPHIGGVVDAGRSLYSAGRGAIDSGVKRARTDTTV